ncbi:hypothetical protein ACFQ88_11260 [Paenibacillus sp. NPDC056579]|uniref:hypothetical protein n=1 Tax=Paenibacillus sp. NPDC056579 TaxID=3345871 RepID=UPI003683727B
MILPLPQKFDANEWFILLAALFVILPSLLLPKRFLAIETVTIFLFNFFVAYTVDSIISVKPLDLYDINDVKEYELMDLLIYLICYCPALYLFLYFYDKWKLRGWKTIMYIVGWSLLTGGLEYLAHLAQVYKYNKWNTAFSVGVYIIAYSTNIGFFHWMRQWLNRPWDGLSKQPRS